jgi:hypothetical protein
MGLGFSFLQDLLTLQRSGALNGQRLIEIGSQQLANAFLEADELLEEVYRAFSRPRIPLGAPNASSVALAPSSREFWKSLGFEYTAIDFDGHRDSIAVDINREPAPEDLKGKFDLVINTGTTEHIVNQENAFRIIHDLACANGIMYHEVPAGDWDHGLFNYTPKFFLLLHKFNDYRELLMRPRSNSDMTIRVALQKRIEREFITPLDVPLELVPRKHRNPWRTLRRFPGFR